jgi:CRP/FNR family transcriptional regulator, cyclic AMP receptor protein
MNQEVPTTILQQGDIFGQISEINNAERDDYALVSDDVDLCVMSLVELKALLKDDSLVNILMMKMMGSRVQEMESRLQSLMFMDSRSRIIEFIVKSVEKNGQRVGYEWLIRGFSTHMEVASITATSRQTVTMIMNELRNENIIHFDRKRLLVRDLDKLKSYISETKS